MKLDANKKKYIKWGFLALIVFLILRYFKNLKPSAPTAPKSTRQGGELPPEYNPEKPPTIDELDTPKFMNKRQMKVVEAEQKRVGGYKNNESQAVHGDFNHWCRKEVCSNGTDYSEYSPNWYCIAETHAVFYGLDLKLNGWSVKVLNDAGVFASVRNNGGKYLMWVDSAKGYTEAIPRKGFYLDKKGKAE